MRPMKAREITGTVRHGGLHTHRTPSPRRSPWPPGHVPNDARPTRSTAACSRTVRVARARPAPPAGAGTSRGRGGCGRDAGGGGPVATAGGADTAGPDRWAEVPHRRGLPHPPRTAPGARLGPAPARPPRGGLAHAEGAAAVAAPRAGSCGDAVARHRGPQPGAAPSLAMDRGGR